MSYYNSYSCNPVDRSCTYNSVFFRPKLISYLHFFLMIFSWAVLSWWSKRVAMLSPEYFAEEGAITDNVDVFKVFIVVVSHCLLRSTPLTRSLKWSFKDSFPSQEQEVAPDIYPLICFPNRLLALGRVGLRRQGITRSS